MDFDLSGYYDAELLQLLIVPLVIGLTEAVKKTGAVARMYWPIISIALGIVISIFLFDNDLQLEVIQGIVAGLTASGLWSGVRTVSSGDRRTL